MKDQIRKMVKEGYSSLASAKEKIMGSKSCCSSFPTAMSVGKAIGYTESR